MRQGQQQGQVRRIKWRPSPIFKRWQAFHNDDRLGLWNPYQGQEPLVEVTTKLFIDTLGSERSVETYMDYLYIYQAWREANVQVLTGEDGKVRDGVVEFMSWWMDRYRRKEIGRERVRKALTVMRQIAYAMAKYYEARTERTRGLKGQYLNKDLVPDVTDLTKAPDDWAMMYWTKQWYDLDDVKPVKERQKGKAKWLGWADVKKLLAACDRETLAGKRDAMLVALMVGMGLRRAEVTRIKGGDVVRLPPMDWSGREWQPGSKQYNAMAKTDERWLVKGLERKGGVKRDTPMPKWVADYVGVWREASGIGDDGPLVRQVDRWGKVQGGVTGDALLKRVRWLASKAGVEVVGLHDLRRTAAELVMVTGGDVRDVQELLGHELLETTIKYLKRSGGKLAQEKLELIMAEISGKFDLPYV